MASVKMDELTSIHGIGPKTAEKIRSELPYETTDELIHGYLTTDAEQIAEIIPNTAGFNKAIRKTEIDNSQLGVYNADIPAKTVMRFIRQFGTLEPFGSPELSEEKIRDKVALGHDKIDGMAVNPSDIDWTSERFLGSREVVEISFGDEPFSEEFINSLTRAESVEQNGDIEVFAGEHSSKISMDVIEDVEVFIGEGIAESPANFRVKEDGDNYPVIIDDPLGEFEISVAPYIP